MPAATSPTNPQFQWFSFSVSSVCQVVRTSIILQKIVYSFEHTRRCGLRWKGNIFSDCHTHTWAGVSVARSWTRNKSFLACCSAMRRGEHIFSKRHAPKLLLSLEPHVEQWMFLRMFLPSKWNTEWHWLSVFSHRVASVSFLCLAKTVQPESPSIRVFVFKSPELSSPDRDVISKRSFSLWMWCFKRCQPPWCNGGVLQAAIVHAGNTCIWLSRSFDLVWPSFFLWPASGEDNTSQLIAP